MERDNPVVSIVMPVYNAGIYLKDALQDIISQSYEDWELICINDGSTDQSLAVLMYYAENDDRIRIITQENQGAGVARNKGINEARGEFLIFLDSDDRFEPEMLRESVRKACDTEADIVIFNGYSFDSDTGYIKNCGVLNEDLIPDRDFSNKTEADNIFQISSACPWNKLYLTEFVKKSKLSFQNKPYMNDVLFVQMSMVLANKITVLNENLVFYRCGNVYSTSGWKKKSANLNCFIEVLKDLKKELENQGLLATCSKSLAKYSLDIIEARITELLNDYTYDFFIECLNDDIFATLGINNLKEKDVEWIELYKDVRCFYEKGSSAFLFRLFHRFSLYYLNREIEVVNEGLALTERSYFFDIGRIPKGSKVVLYGAGVRGQDIYRRNKRADKYRIVLWVDTYVEYLSDLDMKISKPEAMADIEYDYIIIAVDNIESVIEISKMIKQFNYSGKIIW